MWSSVLQYSTLLVRGGGRLDGFTSSFDIQNFRVKKQKYLVKRSLILSPGLRLCDVCVILFSFVCVDKCLCICVGGLGCA